MAEETLFNKYGHTVDAGKVIFKEGEEGDQMYIIQEGTVRISKNIDGKEYTLAVLGKGDFFGEMALLTRVQRTATVTAGDTVKYLSFNREGFIGMIEKNAKIALNVIDKLCRRLQQANMQISHLKKNNERGLIALNIYYAFAEAGLNSTLDSVKVIRDISMNLEISPDLIQEYVKEFEDSGIIAIDNQKMVLKDSGRLSALSTGPEMAQ